ncbi:MAG: bile acid:sodium symporter family protein [Deltaproteobacteria bacterium]|nr:bile acid:sodium symporter family protein [Deltaproteobacteria bacterium]
MGLDQIHLNFNPSSLLALNAIIGLMMFGMALDIRVADFVRILKTPKGPAIGLLAQFIFLPALTFVLTLVIRPAPSIALGMIMVAACPGGNLSNIMTWLAGGSAALSVSMTAVSTMAAIVMTPLNLALWGSLNPDTAPILRQISLEPLGVLGTIVTILGIPMTLGMLVAHYMPALAGRVRGPFKLGSVVVFGAFIAIALYANWRIFVDVIGLVMLVVLAHNALALFTGYASARLARLDAGDVRAVTIEVGIQNSALALILIFDFFGGLGGMAIIAAWWGVWHIIAGLALSFFWSRRPIGPAMDVQQTGDSV